MEVKKASKEDVYFLFLYLRPFIKKRILLFRSLYEVKRDLLYTWVLKDKGDLIGAVTFYPYHATLYEVRALFVKEEYQGRGLGKKLFLEAFEEFSSFLKKPFRLFALTYVPEFFSSLGFQEVPKEMLPEKVYEDCLYCPLQEDCKEKAMLRWVYPE